MTDIGASESMMKKKTKQEFQELLKTEHCKMTAVHWIKKLGFKLFLICIQYWKNVNIEYYVMHPSILKQAYFSITVTALLEGFDIRECITFIEEHINRQVSLR